jgi:hypothetical protein
VKFFSGEEPSGRVFFVLNMEGGFRSILMT